MAKEGFLLSDPFMNEVGDFIFSEFSFGEVKGVFKYNHRSKLMEKVFTNLEGRFSGYSELQLNNEGLILFRGNGPHKSKGVFTYSKGLLEKIVSSPGKGLSYIFGVRMTFGNKIVLKVREGATGQYDRKRPDSLRRYSRENDFEILKQLGPPSSKTNVVWLHLIVYTKLLEAAQDLSSKVRSLQLQIRTLAAGCVKWQRRGLMRLLKSLFGVLDSKNSPTSIINASFACSGRGDTNGLAARAGVRLRRRASAAFRRTVRSLGRDGRCVGPRCPHRPRGPRG